MSAIQLEIPGLKCKCQCNQFNHIFIVNQLEFETVSEICGLNCCEVWLMEWRVGINKKSGTSVYVKLENMLRLSLEPDVEMILWRDLILNVLELFKDYIRKIKHTWDFLWRWPTEGKLRESSLGLPEGFFFLGCCLFHLTNRRTRHSFGWYDSPGLGRLLEHPTRSSILYSDLKTH